MHVYCCLYSVYLAVLSSLFSACHHCCIAAEMQVRQTCVLSGLMYMHLGLITFTPGALVTVPILATVTVYCAQV